MIQRKYRLPGLAFVLPIIALTLLATPAHAAQQSGAQATRNQGATPINATIYLTTATLQPIFQARINQEVPGAVNNAINTIVGNLPANDRTWADQMATTLIQPSATLNSLTPQQNGLATSLRINLYPGDPHPINATILVKFSIINGSTVQVTALPETGSPTLVNGPLTTFQIPLGHLNAINTTPSCGAAALAVNLQFPLSLGQNQQGSTGTTGLASPQLVQQQNTQQAGTNAYVAIPATALASLGSSIGTIPVSKSLTAKNISLAVQGNNLVITSDIYLGFLQIASATTYVQPTAVNGNLAVNVLKTNLTFLQLFTFPNNSYNQQIEQILNAKLNGALSGKFNVTSAAIGANSNIPCASGNNLILTGTTSLV
jgi:hypothetical protein